MNRENQEISRQEGAWSQEASRQQADSERYSVLTDGNVSRHGRWWNQDRHDRLPYWHDGEFSRRLYGAIDLLRLRRAQYGRSDALLFHFQQQDGARQRQRSDYITPCHSSNGGC